MARPIVLLIALALSSAACGPFGPPSAQDIVGKPGRSTEKDGHFNATATLVNGATHYIGTGAGSIVLQPKYALKVNLQVASGTILGNVGVDLIAIGGKQYERVANGAWSITDDTSSPSNANKKPTYIGESEFGSDKAWHVRSKSGDSTYDEWVRESDGYLLKYEFSKSDGTDFVMNFDQFNVGTNVVPPSTTEIAASQYQALVDPLNSQNSSLSTSLQSDASSQDLSSFKTDIGKIADNEQAYVDGLKKIDFPASMQGDVQAVLAAEVAVIADERAASQTSNWADAIAKYNAATGSDVLTKAITKLRTDLGLPPPSS
ncbi:MAG TPA: hypothetical protein VF137_09070 [Candidatus Dormibacteraeota bacterium]